MHEEPNSAGYQERLQVVEDPWPSWLGKVVAKVKEPPARVRWNDASSYGMWQDRLPHHEDLLALAIAGKYRTSLQKQES